ncbi:MAG: hypothetical protein IT258_24480 [Saprospiraceae bacterium]|nr:hypothetical protein [Saprospiraceae bacterium]
MAIPIDKYKKRIDVAIELGKQAFAKGDYPRVDGSFFGEFRSAGISILFDLFGQNHPQYLDFFTQVDKPFIAQTEIGIGIMTNIKREIENGWLDSLKGLVSAEIFSDFLEMASHLLDEGYKDPAAVMVGSVLEEHLRQLCGKNGIPPVDPKTGKPKKADTMNAELGKVAYNLLDQKAVLNWLELRNKAAHGKYGEYNVQQVGMMVQGVTEFMARNSV